jgi:sugar phosphate isomerase/epimerase
MEVFLMSRISKTLSSFLLLLSLAVPFCWTDATAGMNGDSPDNVLACRFASYGRFKESAWEHLPKIGIHHVFLGMPARHQVEATMELLAKHDLTPVVLRGDTNLSMATSVAELASQLEICEKMGVKYMFLSPKRHGAPKEVIYGRLREVGEVAKKHGVTVALETHPDLGTNGDVHLETMKQIDHPNIRVNFDTANITYYNKNTNAVEELKKILDYVATVELKDHTEEFETWNFPAVGQGVVDMPEILRILKEHGYTGPITLEFEGIKGVTLNECETQKAIAESVAYVRSLGSFK